ncbi:MAG TPA: metallophosphoesterase [Armatimonadota bacterium]|nr:metallophosphoesterase [Armatimonadota bacterium]
MLAAFVVARIAVDALIARFVLGVCSRAFRRALGAILVADVVVALIASLLIYWMANRSAGSATHRLSATLGAGAVMLLMILLVWEGAIWLALRPSPPSRCRVGAAAALLLLAGLGPITAAGTVQDRLNLPARVTNWQVPVRGLPPAFDGLRVCCIGDVHLHRGDGSTAMRARLRPLARLRPDLILFVGDYATGDARYEAQAAQVIAEQRAPLGVYAVLGNHDRWIGEADSLRALRGARVRVLVNESIALKRGGEALYVAGVNDPYTGGDDLDAALSGAPAKSCVILLAHSPDIIAQARGRVALVLAGHTHGGQINLPLMGPPVVLSRYGNRYAHGLFREGTTAMFVTRGAGEIFPNVRFNCPREIALLTLRRAAAPTGSSPAGSNSERSVASSRSRRSR